MGALTPSYTTLISTWGVLHRLAPRLTPADTGRDDDVRSMLPPELLELHTTSSARSAQLMASSEGTVTPVRVTTTATLCAGFDERGTRTTTIVGGPQSSSACAHQVDSLPLVLSPSSLATTTGAAFTTSTTSLSALAVDDVQAGVNSPAAVAGASTRSGSAHPTTSTGGGAIAVRASLRPRDFFSILCT